MSSPFFMAYRQWCPCSRWHFQKLDPTCTNILNKIRKVLYFTWIHVAFVSSPEMMYCTMFSTVQEDAVESIVSIVHSRGFSLVLSGSVLNVQKLVTLLNVIARNPLVLRCRKSLGILHCLRSFSSCWQYKMFPFYKLWNSLVFVHEQRIISFLTMSSRPIQSIDCFTAFSSSFFSQIKTLSSPSVSFHFSLTELGH